MKNLSLNLILLAALTINVSSAQAVNNQVKISTNNQSQSQNNQINNSTNAIECLNTWNGCRFF